MSNEGSEKTDALPRIILMGEPGGGKTILLIELAGNPPPRIASSCALPVAPQRLSVDISSSSRSVGLGLYIVEQIVTAHQGTVDVVSSEAEARKEDRPFSGPVAPDVERSADGTGREFSREPSNSRACPASAE